MQLVTQSNPSESPQHAQQPLAERPASNSIWFAGHASRRSSGGLQHQDKLILFAIAGGFLGGWVYDTKWFYRVTARGKNDQYKFPWQPHKFYWRIFTPFLSSLVALSTLMLAYSDFLPIAIKSKDSARAAFAICFLFGYFSDLLLSRLASWAEKIIPRVSRVDS